MTARLDRAVRREALAGHDGRSGARLERATLDDGTTLVVKTAPPGSDLAGLLSGDPVRELRLWTAGVLDHLPPGVHHAILDGWTEPDGTIVTVMRDLGHTSIGWRAIRGCDSDRLVAAAAAVHRALADVGFEDACPLERRLTLLAPNDLEPADGNPLPALIRRGWDRFDTIAPDDIVTEVHRIFEDPAPLAAALRRTGTTLVHGDLTLVNAALEPDRVTLIDWGLATEGPPALDLALLLASSASNIDTPRETVIEDYCRHLGDLHDETSLRLALAIGLLELGWNKALDIVENPAIAERERTDLDWWIAQTRTAFELASL